MIDKARTTDPGRPSGGLATLENLPPYSLSLLRIHMPVAVILAGKKEKVGEILQLCPGSIIKFDKACDEALALAVGNVPVAEGDAVKVGDKFGLRISKILLPSERFHRASLQRNPRGGEQFPPASGQ
jgi:flagellar motor switch/type III secretory pathway protein FliN